MIRSMADQPIIFAMANPDPEITPEEVAAIRDDAIVATGRSDYPNQVNNVLGFPYIFRGALDVRATTINEEMKVAAARGAGRAGARGRARRGGRRLSGRQRPKFGPHYIIPVPFDSRLLVGSAGGGGQGGDGYRRGAQADRRHGAIQGAALGAARPDRRHAAADLPAGAADAEARRLRRGRGGADDPRGGELRFPQARHRHPDRPRGDRARVRRARRHRPARGGGDQQCAAVDAQRRIYRLPLCPPAAQGLPVPRRAAPGQFRPQPFRRLHGGARRRRRHGLGRDAQLFDGAGRRAAGSSTRSPATR